MERLQTPQKILGILSSVNFPPLLVESEVTQPRANDRQEGRRASRQLRLSPPFPGPGVLRRTFGGGEGAGRCRGRQGAQKRYQPATSCLGNRGPSAHTGKANTPTAGRRGGGEGQMCSCCPHDTVGETWEGPVLPAPPGTPLGQVTPGGEHCLLP